MTAAAAHSPGSPADPRAAAVLALRAAAAQHQRRRLLAATAPGRRVVRVRRTRVRAERKRAPPPEPRQPVRAPPSPRHALSAASHRSLTAPSFPQARPTNRGPLWVAFGLLVALLDAFARDLQVHHVVVVTCMSAAEGALTRSIEQVLLPESSLRQLWSAETVLFKVLAAWFAVSLVERAVYIKYYTVSLD